MTPLVRITHSVDWLQRVSQVKKRRRLNLWWLSCSADSQRLLVPPSPAESRMSPGRPPTDDRGTFPKIASTKPLPQMIRVRATLSPRQHATAVALAQESLGRARRSHDQSRGTHDKTRDIMSMTIVRGNVVSLCGCPRYVNGGLGLACPVILCHKTALLS